MVTIEQSQPSGADITRLFYVMMSVLLAAIVIVAPGVERSLPVFNFGPHWYLVIDALVILIALFGPVVDLITRHRIHPAYFYGIGTM